MALRNFSVKRIPIPAEMEVRLSDTEDRICKLLDEYVKDTQPDASTRTICRIAGGWVRDKLLGSQSNDIDIALSDTMGFTFAEGLAAYANEKGVATGTISKIAQNPDQSKHLETATFKVFGLDIDLVNLRSEEYSSDSRIPTGISFGTPLQDALRRDITINALFYNVHSREVEDFTGVGRNDLRHGIIRTPLSPRETFLDDPLRVLRCVRFASRLGFEIVPEIDAAAKDPKAIVNKVARERVGEEVSKMIKGRDPLRSIKLIYELSLYDPIFFVIPEASLFTLSGSPTSPSVGLAAASILHYLLENRAHTLSSNLPILHPLFYRAVDNDPTCSHRLYLAASLTPYRSITYRDKKNEDFPLVELVIRESLKLGKQSHFLDGIPHLFAASNIIIPFVAEQDKSRLSSERVSIGLLLRESSVHKPSTGSHWTSSFLFSLVQELIGHYDAENDALNYEQASAVIEKYNKFVERIESLKLEDASELKCLLNGPQAIAALTLEGKRKGPWLGQLLNNITEWQLKFPEGTKDDCVSWLKEQQQLGLIQIDDVSEPLNKRSRAKR
ncbi:CCA tRNA nucleotidyltransferase, mitochondrial [Leucoagaricus sp. SymC.cos]|nr:CCA tRNA nucleotidyltransferase, mitochondrial [Leucoagaricus sp. SymC.cos]